MDRMRGVDVVAGLLSALCLLEAAVVLVLQPTYRAMFQDFGGELPLWSQLFLRPLPVVLLGLIPGLLAIEGVLGKRSETAQIGRCMVAMAAALALVVGFIAAVYLPIFSLAGEIK